MVTHSLGTLGCARRLALLVVGTDALQASASIFPVPVTFSEQPGRIIERSKMLKIERAEKYLA